MPLTRSRRSSMGSLLTSARQRGIDRPGLHVQPDQLQPDERDGDGDGRRRGECCGIEPLPGHGLRQASNHHKQQPRSENEQSERGELHEKLVPPHEGPQSRYLCIGDWHTSGTSGSTSGSSAQTEEANIARVKVDLPKQLPSRLTTLQKACTAAVFDANPAACPAASIVASAKAITPILPVPLEGPAYFVSHGNEAFPQLILVLQGYGITIDLVGDTFISKAGITSSTFAHVPDAPVSSFELTLPQGKY